MDGDLHSLYMSLRTTRYDNMSLLSCFGDMLFTLEGPGGWKLANGKCIITPFSIHASEILDSLIGESMLSQKPPFMRLRIDQVKTLLEANKPCLKTHLKIKVLLIITFRVFDTPSYRVIKETYFSLTIFCIFTFVQIR